MVDSLRGLLARLVAARTVSSDRAEHDQDPADGLALLADLCRERGGRCRQIANPGRPGKPMLLADFGPDAAPAAMLSGHIDTVPAAAGWSGDPWQLREEADRWFGLGVSDMKGFFAAALAGLEAMPAPDTWARTLRLVATTDEETGMAGARALAAAGLLPAVSTVIGEPTDGRRGVACKGIMFFELAFEGRDGHASLMPEHGVAAQALTIFLHAVEQWRRSLPERLQDLRFEPAQSTVNIGRIAGGDAHNRLARRFDVSVELRLLPGDDADRLRAELRAMAETAAGSAGVDLVFEEHFHLPAFANAAARAGGRDGAFLPYATEAPWFPDGGREVEIWGPGAIAAAHTADEWVSIPALSEYTVQLVAWMEARCRT